MKNNRGIVRRLTIVISVLILIIGCSFFIKKIVKEDELGITNDNVWSKERLPSEYNFEQFEQLSEKDKIAFQNWFDEGEFDNWYISATDGLQTNDWEDVEKLPNEYTLEEFNELSTEQQIAFQNWFEKYSDFEAWMYKAEGYGENIPWENGGKAPNEYSLSEFNELNTEQQIEFQKSFGDIENFKKWMNTAEQ